MAKIRSLKPNVSREEATEQFSSGGILGLLRDFVSGPLRSVADFYIPFRIFQVEVTNAGKREQRVFGLDAVSGLLDPYEFPSLPGAEDVICLETRNCVQPILDETGAKELIADKVRRVLFSAGFFRLRELKISVEAVPGEIHVPYWVGFRGRGTHAQFAVMDAVRRRMEGAKVRQLLQGWLTST